MRSQNLRPQKNADRHGWPLNVDALVVDISLVTRRRFGCHDGLLAHDLFDKAEQFRPAVLVEALEISARECPRPAGEK